MDKLLLVLLLLVFKQYPKTCIQIVSADILFDIDFESLSNYDILNLGRKQSQIPELAPTNLKTRNWFLFFPQYIEATLLFWGKYFSKIFPFGFRILIIMYSIRKWIIIFILPY